MSTIPLRAITAHAFILSKGLPQLPQGAAPLIFVTNPAYAEQWIWLRRCPVEFGYFCPDQEDVQSRADADPAARLREWYRALAEPAVRRECRRRTISVNPPHMPAGVQ